jgi:FKBP-type peptidyl-prolyl cis-trans isomerase FklB
MLGDSTPPFAYPLAECKNICMRKPIGKTVIILMAGMLLLASAVTRQASAQQSPAANSQHNSAPQGQNPPASSASQTPGAATNSVLKTDKDKAGYAIGANIGDNLRRQGVDVDPAMIALGLKDSMGGGKTLLTEDEMKGALTALQGEVRKAQEEKLAQATTANKKEGEAFLAANKTKAGVVTLPSGLQYKILTAGTGPKPTATDTVVCNYKGTLINNTEFDSSYKHGQPATFPVGQVIKGWTEALQLMPVGSKWQLFVPSDLAYGDRGAGPDIGPNATLIFEVELLSIKPPSAAAAPAKPATSSAAPAAAPPAAAAPKK